MSDEKKSITYADAGVNIDAGNKAVELMKDSVRATYRPEVIGDLGGFGGLFALGSYKNPVLVSGTDGVGTKLKIAFLMDRHDTIGQDAVAMCVNDILVQGAEPLFFSITLQRLRWIPKRLLTSFAVWPAPAKNRAVPLLAVKPLKWPAFMPKMNMTLPVFPSVWSNGTR